MCYQTRIIKKKDAVEKRFNAIVDKVADITPMQTIKAFDYPKTPIITDEKNIVKIGYPLQEPAPGYSIWNAITFYKKNLEEGYLYYINVQ